VSLLGWEAVMVRRWMRCWCWVEWWVRWEVRGSGLKGWVWGEVNFEVCRRL
jgi:hypothetical protein